MSFFTSSYTRKSALIAFSLAGLSLIAGCGGGESTVGGPANTDSPFLGSYSGAFTTSGGQAGTTSLSVDADGDVTGTVVNTTISAQGPVSGRIENSGDADITFTYTGLGSAQLRGPISYRASDNKLVGTLTQSSNGVQTDTVNVSLGKLP